MDTTTAADLVIGRDGACSSTGGVPPGGAVIDAPGLGDPAAAIRRATLEEAIGVVEALMTRYGCLTAAGVRAAVNALKDLQEQT